MSDARKEFLTATLADSVVSRFKQAMKHESPEALQKYLKEHPGADRSLHSVDGPTSRKKEHGDTDPTEISSFGKGLSPETRRKIKEDAHREYEDRFPSGPRKHPPLGKNEIDADDPF